MYAARLQRRTPYVDKTVYTGWNGMCISAYIAAGRVLGLRGARGVCAEVAGPRAGGGVDAMRGWRMWWRMERVWRRSGRFRACWTTMRLWRMRRWMRGRRAGRCATSPRREQIADAMLKRFYDVTGCGFFDTELNSAEERIGSADGAAEAAAGFSDAGGQRGCGDGAVAAGGSDEQQGL